jgi:magnesium-transporting ATPase (P-type)
MWKKKKNNTKMAFNTETVMMAAKAPLNTVLTYFQTTSLGLTDEEVEKRQGLYGKNEIVHEQKKKPLVMLAKAFINPFVGVLTALVAISFVMDVWMADPGDQDWTSIIVVSTMIILSTILRFVQEWKANRSSEALQKMVTNTCYVVRLGSTTRGGTPGAEISNEELVPGDLIMLSAGDMIPADIRIIESKDLFVSQSSLTGESDSIEKFPNLSKDRNHTGSIVDLDNICFMGSNVVSGSAKGIVFATGNHTYLGTIAKNVAGHRAATAFDKGITKVSLLLIRFMLVMVPIVLLENGVQEGRKTFGNIVKYVKMTASSNFGNMFSVLAASAFLPFLPMLPIHLLIQNLLYDISQTTIPFDRMDKEYLAKPRVWDSGDLSRFMIWIGPISSIFDIATYMVMWWVFKCQGPDMESLFQSGWFVEGLLSQTLIVHMIRTRKVPFIQSSASWSVMLMTFSIMAVGICIPFTSFGCSIGLTPLPWTYFPWLVGILLSYCVLTQWLKTLYIRSFKRWL